MTDNEKRAHDLALSYYKDVLNMKIDEAARQAAETAESNEVTINVTVDAYKTYKELYDITLEVLNRDYPDGK